MEQQIIVTVPVGITNEEGKPLGIAENQQVKIMIYRNYFTIVYHQSLIMLPKKLMGALTRAYFPDQLDVQVTEKVLELLKGAVSPSGPVTLMADDLLQDHHNDSDIF